MDGCGRQATQEDLLCDTYRMVNDFGMQCVVRIMTSRPNIHIWRKQYAE